MFLFPCLKLAGGRRKQGRGQGSRPPAQKQEQPGLQGKGGQGEDGAGRSDMPSTTQRGRRQSEAGRAHTCSVAWPPSTSWEGPVRCPLVATTPTSPQPPRVTVRQCQAGSLPPPPAFSFPQSLWDSVGRGAVGWVPVTPDAAWPFARSFHLHPQ